MLQIFGFLKLRIPIRNFIETEQYVKSLLKMKAWIDVHEHAVIIHCLSWYGQLPTLSQMAGVNY